MQTNFIKYKYKFKKFTKEQRSSFTYWYYHWKAFNLTAYHLGHWRFKYLFHDIEKPWLMLFWKDYNRVQKWHRTHNSHHTEYKGQWDTYAMVIDWECSRFTKSEAQLNAYDTLKRMNRHYTIEHIHSTFYGFEYVCRCSDSHEVTWFVGWEYFIYNLNHLIHLFSWFTYS